MKVSRFISLTFIVISLVLSGCHPSDQPINTAEELEESSDKISAADFVEYGLLNGEIEFGGEELEISSNKKEVVIHKDNYGTVDDVIQNSLDTYGSDTQAYEAAIDEMKELTRLIKTELVNNDYPQDCVIRFLTSGEIGLEIINGKVIIDNVSEAYLIRAEELRVQEDEEFFDSMTTFADDKYQMALRCEEIYREMAQGNLIDAYDYGYYVYSLGMAFYLKGTIHDYTSDDFQLLGEIAQAMCHEFGDTYTEIWFSDLGYGEFDNGSFSIVDDTGSEIWYNTYY